LKRWKYTQGRWKPKILSRIIVPDLYFKDFALSIVDFFLEKPLKCVPQGYYAFKYLLIK
jgi:hypothetical protein